MKLKVYRARTMAEALTEVKKDLGAAAVILHTKQAKVGGFMGFGVRTIYEVTATDDPAVAGRRKDTAVRRKSPPLQARAAQPVLRAPPPASAQGQRAASPPALASTRAAKAYASTPIETDPIEVVRPESTPAIPLRTPSPIPAPAQTMRVRGGPSLPTDLPPQPAEGAEIRTELTSLKRMLSEVLRSQRTTDATPRSVGSETDALFDTYLALTNEAVPHDIADEIVGRTRDELSGPSLKDPAAVRAEARRQIERRLRVVEPFIPAAKQPGARPRVIACVGPTGVGKTTTIAKLAASYKLRHNRRVGLITCDTYRIAAVEQLRTYADIIGLPLKVVLTSAEMHAAIAALTDCDVILIDTAGRSPTDADRLSELRETLALARPDETHLVVSATASQPVIERIAQNFATLKPNRAIITKIDEAVGLGSLTLVSETVRVPISYTTHGQEVPDHIEAATTAKLATLVLPEPTLKPASATQTMTDNGNQMSTAIGSVA